MTAHRNVEVATRTNFRDIESDTAFDRLIFTGPIDEYFDYCHGRLPWRSLEFDFKTIEKQRFQPVAQVNYPANYDFTRITEFAHFLDQRTGQTTIAEEYPTEYRAGENDPYYPVPRPENEEIYEKYAAEAVKLNGRVFFTGRLANYKYYNMDEVCGVALQLFEKNIANI
jgi:UDP-galactopyranose mutase